MLKVDKEPSIVALQQRISEAWTGEVITENSPVGSSQSNGVVEKAVQETEGQIRTVKIALEGRLGVKVETSLPIMQCLIEHSADIIDHFRKRKDGDGRMHKSARQQRMGKEDKPNMCEFGEYVHHTS